jgi:Tol biopolymer transport system component
VNSDGRQGNSKSHAPSISADGTLIVFDSSATNLTDDKCDNGLNHVFVRDVTAGTTRCVSVRSNGNEGNGDSSNPSISADGRVVVFQSAATNLADRCDNGNSHIYTHNLAMDETRCISLNNNGDQSNGNSALPKISGDGRFVAFESNPTNFTQRCSNGFTHIFVRDTVEDKTTCASIDNNGNQGNNDSVQPSMSSDGRFVAFSSAASNLTGKRCKSGNVQVFVRDRANDETKCASLGPKDVEGNGESSNPSISANGTLVTFESDASNLVKKDTNGLRDIFGRSNSISKSTGGTSFTIFLHIGNISAIIN